MYAMVKRWQDQCVFPLASHDSRLWLR